MEILPAQPLSNDLVDRIAREVAALVCDHIETMYSPAIENIAWRSAKRSIQGVVRNAVSAAGEAAEQGQADAWIKRSASHRRRYMKMHKVTYSPSQ